MLPAALSLLCEFCGDSGDGEAIQLLVFERPRERPYSISAKVPLQCLGDGACVCALSVPATCRVLWLLIVQSNGMVQLCSFVPDLWQCAFLQCSLGVRRGLGCADLHWWPCNVARDGTHHNVSDLHLL